MNNKHKRSILKHFKKNKLRFYIGACMMSTMLASCSCSSDDSSSSTSTVVIDSSVPSIMQVGETAQGSVALSSTVTSLTSIDAEDIREITMTDTSSCNPKLTIFPSSLMVTVDGNAETFNVTAPAGNCLHTVTFSGTGVSTSTNTSDVNVITDQAVVTVGLYDTEGAETVTVIQGGTLYVKFTPPDDWEGVTAEQSYTVTSNTDGVTITNSPCSLTPPTTTACQVTVTIGDDLAVGEYTLSFAQGSGTDVPIDISSIEFNVESIANPTFYVANYGSGEISKCNGEDGNLVECANASTDDGDINAPSGLAIMEINSSNRLYMASYDDANVTGCELDENGEFDLSDAGSCNEYNNLGTAPEGFTDIAIQKVGDDIFAYITNYDGSQVTICPINTTTGAINGANCTEDTEAVAGVSGFGDLDAVTTVEFDNGFITAYIADNDDNILWQCPIKMNGSLDNCTNTDALDIEGGGNPPLGLAVHKVNNTWYLFVPTETDKIFTCAVSSTDGAFSPGCITTGVIETLDEPRGIAIQEIDNEFYAYVTNVSNNTVSRCLITKATGLIAQDACEVASSDDPDPKDFDEPWGIAVINLP